MDSVRGEYMHTVFSFQVDHYLLGSLKNERHMMMNQDKRKTVMLYPAASGDLAIEIGMVCAGALLPLIIGLSASCALFLPVSTPPNAIAYSTGLLKQSEFRLGGVSVGLIGPALIILWVLMTNGS